LFAEPGERSQGRFASGLDVVGASDQQDVPFGQRRCQTGRRQFFAVLGEHILQASGGGVSDLGWVEALEKNGETR
jgi:hypothetical protein